MRLPSIANILSKKLLSFMGKSNTKKVLGVLVFFTITILIVFSSFNPNMVMLKPDEVAPRNIQSNTTSIIIDEAKTQELKNQAAAQVQKVYQEDTYALTTTRNEINNFFNDINDIRELDENQEDKLEELIVNTEKEDRNVDTKNTSNEMARYLVNVTADDLQQMQANAINIVNNIMAKPITEETLASVFDQAAMQIDQLEYSLQAREIMKIVVINSIKPNLIFNKEATKRAIEEAMDRVKPVQKTIKAGEIIVREGNRVTAEQISILEQLGIQRTKNYSLTIVGSALFVLLTFWLTIEFIGRNYKTIYENHQLMILVGLVFIIMLALTRFLTVIKIGDMPDINSLVGYLVPISAGSMLITILLNNRLAYFLTMIMALYVGLLTEGNQLFYAITAFVGGTVGIFQVNRLNQTSDLARSGFYIAIVNIISILTLSLIGGNVTLKLILVGMTIGAVNGILSAILMIGALPYLESAFSITSMIKLLELSNPNQELLKKLLMEAPGTYHHSLMVGNLAEASAESIGANPLLVRVGAYYHDIGKLKRPDYFVENQRGFDNPHEKIAPALSALIITSHVREGVEMAREAHLPEDIISFIEQHHGTGLAKYFFSRALEEDREGSLSEDSFRYEGPKPQSKEVALVMLADSVEAGVRSLPDPTPEKIKNMVRSLIRDKLNDGQLESCDLTFKDLDVISNLFCKSLEGLYHKRIEYPEVIVREFEKRREKDGDLNNKSAK
jgi:putative nucleotidyltransferase with HDIG domain